MTVSLKRLSSEESKETHVKIVRFLDSIGVRYSMNATGDMEVPWPIFLNETKLRGGDK